jgi:hypothetical protein
MSSTKKVKVIERQFYVVETEVEVEVPKYTRFSNILAFIEEQRIGVDLKHKKEQQKTDGPRKAIPTEVMYTIVVNNKKEYTEIWENAGLSLLKFKGRYEK